jgi:hypothetical protein
LRGGKKSRLISDNGSQPFLANFTLLNHKIRPIGKDANFTGQPVFNQLLKLIPCQQVKQWSKNIRGSEKYVKNFQLHFFYGDTVNAIEIQTGVVLIAHLLCTVIQQKIKRHCSFSQNVTMLRQTLMYYIDFVAFMENPNKGWQIIAEEHGKSPPQIVQYSLVFE